mmetsp:Transcript_68574/g.138972  ORF Transcript_68574/g.138972 Transcript_68574/m.138972 type:complete len:215 (+) Transcript_68574:269-913(+)
MRMDLQLLQRRCLLAVAPPIAPIQKLQLKIWTWPKSSSHLGCNGNELPSGCSKMNFNPLETATYMSNIQRQASRFPTATKPYPQFPRGLQKSRPCVPRDILEKELQHNPSQRRPPRAIRRTSFNANRKPLVVVRSMRLDRAISWDVPFIPIDNNPRETHPIPENSSTNCRLICWGMPSWKLSMTIRSMSNAGAPQFIISGTTMAIKSNKDIEVK